MHNFDFVKPSGVADAVKALAADGAQALSGGRAMTGIMLFSAARMARISPFFALWHGMHRIDDRRVISGVIFVERAKGGGDTDKIMIDATPMNARTTAAGLLKKPLFPGLWGACGGRWI